MAIWQTLLLVIISLNTGINYIRLRNEKKTKCKCGENK